MKAKYLAATAFLIGTQLGPARAAAQAVKSTVPTEIELRITATGQFVSRADVVTIYVPITTQGKTSSAARAANSQAIAALTVALVSRGIGRESVTMASPGMRYGFMGNQGGASEVRADIVEETPTAEWKTAYSTVKIRLNSPALLSRVLEALDAENRAMAGTPIYSLRDERPAKNAATADALARARLEAEVYASSLGLRVDRITGVSNYNAAPSQYGADPDTLMRIMSGEPNDNATDRGGVTSNSQVWVDFILVPR